MLDHEKAMLIYNRMLSHPEAHFQGRLDILERPRSKHGIVHIPEKLRSSFTFDSQNDTELVEGWKCAAWGFTLSQPDFTFLLKKRFPRCTKPDEVKRFVFRIKETNTHRVFFELCYRNEDHNSYVLDLFVEIDQEKTPPGIIEAITGAPETFFPPRRTWVVQKMREWQEEFSHWEYPPLISIRNIETILGILTTECVPLCNIVENHPRIKMLHDPARVASLQAPSLLQYYTWSVREYVSCSCCSWRGFDDGEYDTHPRPVLVAVNHETGEGTYLCPACFQARNPDKEA